MEATRDPCCANCQYASILFVRYWCSLKDVSIDASVDAFDYCRLHVFVLE